MTSNIGFQIDDKTFTLHETSAAAAEAAAQRAEAAVETVSGSVAQIATNTQDITALKEDLTQSVDDLKSALELQGSEMGIYEAAHYAHNSLRWAIIPFTFVNGKSYFLDIKNSENDISEVRISSAGNLDTASTIFRWASINAKSFSVTYNCAVNNATHLIIITPSSNTSISLDYAICEFDIREIVSQAQTGAVNSIKNKGVLSSLANVYFQTQASYTISESNCIVKIKTNSAGRSGYYNYNGDWKDFQPQTNGTLIGDKEYSFTLTNDHVLVIDDSTTAAGVSQLAVKDGLAVTNTDIVILSFFKNDTMSKVKGILGDYLTRQADKSEINAEISAIRADVSSLGNSYPSYYDTNDYLKTKIAKINNTAPVNGAVIGFITDLHFNANQMNSLKLLKYLRKQTSMNTILCGGDFIDAYGSDARLQTDIDKAMQYAKELYPDWIALRGNHDFTIREGAGSSNGTTLGDGITYNTIVRACAEWRYEVPVPEVSFIDTENNMNKNYCWTLTNEQAKIRVIGFCDFNTTNTGTYWGVGRRITNAYAKYLGQMLLASDGYSIILFTHAPITAKLEERENNIISVVKKFVSREAITLGSYTMDFSNATGILICALSGHSHKDQFAFADGFLNVNTTCDATYNDDPGVTRTAGTISEQAFDVMNIDTDNKLLRCVRIGGGYDRLFHYQPVAVSTTETLTSELTGTLTWVSSDTDVATVTDGVVTSIATGECYVTATDASGNKEYWAIVT